MSGIVSVSLCCFLLGTQRQLTFRAARWCSLAPFLSLIRLKPQSLAEPFFFSRASAELEKGDETIAFALFLSPLQANPWRNHSIRFKLTANCNSNISSIAARYYIYSAARAHRGPSCQCKNCYTLRCHDQSIRPLLDLD